MGERGVVGVPRGNFVASFVVSFGENLKLETGNLKLGT